MTVDINHVSGNTWSISLTDAGKWSWSKNVTYSSSESSGEWILEAPTLVAQTLLAPVGTVHFGPTSTYTAGGKTVTMTLKAEGQKLCATFGGVAEVPESCSCVAPAGGDCNPPPDGFVCVAIGRAAGAGG